MSNIVIGTGGIHEQPLEWGWSPTHGFYTIRSWRGELNPIIAQAGLMRALGWQIRIVNGPTTNSTLTATSAADPNGNTTDVVDSWEIQPNSVTKAIYHSNVQQNLGISDVEMLKIQNWNKGDTKPTFSNANANTMFDLMQEGVTEFIEHQPILRHTQTVSNSRQVAASLNNVRRIIRTASMVSLEIIPGWIYQSMPNYTQPDDTRLNYGWYKAPPNITVVSYNRTHIVQEWQFGVWAVLIYGAAL